MRNKRQSPARFFLRSTEKTSNTKSSSIYRGFSIVTFFKKRRKTNIVYIQNRKVCAKGISESLSEFVCFGGLSARHILDSGFVVFILFIMFYSCILGFILSCTFIQTFSTSAGSRASRPALRFFSETGQCPPLFILRIVLLLHSDSKRHAPGLLLSSPLARSAWCQRA